MYVKVTDVSFFIPNYYDANALQPLAPPRRVVVVAELLSRSGHFRCN